MRPAGDPIDVADAILAAARSGEDVRDRLRQLPEDWRSRVEEMLEQQRCIVTPGTPGSRDDRTGTHIGRYEIVGELGAGGQARVFDAVDEELGRRVALKLLHNRASSRHEARLRRESRALSQLRDARICSIFDVGVHDGQPFVVMEQVEGSSLSAYIELERAKAGELGASKARIVEAVRITTELARALAGAHDTGLVHRDLKPANIMLRDDGTPVVLDFGLVHEDRSTEESLTHTGDAVGTPAYMAPEQIDGSSIDARCDVYALGLVLFELLTLERAFQAPSWHALFETVLGSPPLDVARIPRWVPQDLRVATATAMARDRDLRYLDMTAFADDLEAFAEGRPIQARPLPAFVRFGRWVRREPMRAVALVAGLVLAVLVGFVAAEWPRLSERNERLAAIERAEDARRAAARGYIALHTDAIDVARASFEEATALDPSQRLARAGLALASFAVRDNERAIAILAGSDDPAFAYLRDTILAGEPVEADRAMATDGVLEFVRGTLLYGRWRQVQDRSLLRRAHGHYGNAIRLPGNDHAVYHYLRTLVSAVLKDRAAYLASSAAVEARWPDEPWTWSVLARASLDFDGGASDGVRFGRRAVAANPDDPEALAYMGALLGNAGQMSEAIAAFDRSLAVRPTAMAWGIRGNLHQNRREWDQAIECYRKAEALLPGVATSAARIGTVLIDSGRPEEAIPHLQRALEIQPESVNVMHELGRAFGTSGQTQEALVWLERVRAIDDAGWRVHYMLARAYGDLNDWNASRDASLEALRRFPDPELESSVLYACQLSADSAANLEAMREVVALRKESPHAAVVLGMLLHGEGELSAAREQYERAATLFASDDNLTEREFHARERLAALRAQLDEATESGH